MSAEPDINELPLGYNNEFLVLGSSGLWDQLDHQDVLQAVESAVKESMDDPDDPWNAANASAEVCYYYRMADHVI